MELLLIFGEISGNLVELYTYDKLQSSFINKSEPVNIHLYTNKEEIIVYKYYLKSSLSELTKMIKNPKITKIDIIAFGETYKNLTGKNGNKIIEPNKKEKVNIFNLFHFYPFTTITLETFFLQVKKDFCKYRLKYLYSNVPIIDLNNNPISLELINEVDNLYYNKKIYIDDNYDFTNKIPLFVNFFKLKQFLNNKLYLPKLSNMNKVDINISLSQENIINKDLKYQKIEFFFKSYSGIFKIKDVNLILSDNSLQYFYKLFDNYISFDLLKIILKKYPDKINNITIETIYFSSIINTIQYFKDKNYNYNFFIELYNHPLYKIILIQNILSKNILYLSEKVNINNYGIFSNSLIVYLDKYDVIKKYNSDNKYIYYVPYEEEIEEIDDIFNTQYNKEIDFNNFEKEDFL